jgi:lipopolysaccharide/colanic/teichoic acid biosynthesis glycosyltransferase
MPFSALNDVCVAKGIIVVVDPNQIYLRAPLMRAPEIGYYLRFVKRWIDIILVAILAIPTVLILMLIIPCIMVSSAGSVFYKQQRIGKNGQVFWMWKLRSMVPDAKQKLEDYLALNPEAREEWDLTQKLKDDPRITRIGRLIRKTSLDELPQLWNVLIGEMSLVGPRPMMVEQRDLYPGAEYFSMLPGITGFWQTSKRNECSFAERAYFDAKYFHEMSFETDIWVLMKTIGVVLKPTGR